MSATLDEYLNLITSQYATAPKFIALLSVLAQWAVDRRNMLETVPALYDVDVAVGQQEDVVGEWVGFSRRLLVPIAGVYFAFDTEGVGFDQGVWFGPFDPTEGLTSLDDATYRLMLYLKISANHWNGSFEDAQTLLSNFAEQGSPGTVLFLQDNYDMSMTIAIAGHIPSTLFLSLLAGGYSSLRPAAVKQNVVVTSAEGAPLFGFDVENDYISGFDVGAWGYAGSVITELGTQWINLTGDVLPWVNNAGQEVQWVN